MKTLITLVLFFSANALAQTCFQPAGKVSALALKFIPKEICVSDVRSETFTLSLYVIVTLDDDSTHSLDIDYSNHRKIGGGLEFTTAFGPYDLIRGKGVCGGYFNMGMILGLVFKDSDYSFDPDHTSLSLKTFYKADCKAKVEENLVPYKKID